MHKYMYRLWMVAILALLPELSHGEDVAALLRNYNDAQLSEKITTANQLMKIYNEEELTDGLLHFAPSATEEEVNRQVWYWSAEHFYDTQEFDQAIANGQRALPLCKNTDMEADCLNTLAMAHFRLSHFTEAVEYAKQCYQLDEKSGDPDVMSSSLNTIAGIYLGANQPQEAEQYILKAIDMARQADNPTRMAVLQGTASEIYHAMKNDEKALEHINAACDIERTLGRDDKLAVRLTQKASALNGLQRYDEAERVLAEAIPQLRQMGDLHSLAIAYNKMGTSLFYQQRQREAIGYFTQAADIFMDMGDIANEMHSRRGLYESYWDLNPDSAKINLDRFDLLKDSLYAHASAADLARYEAEFAVDWHKQEAEKQRERTHLVIIGLSMLALLVAALVWFAMRQRAKKKERALQAIINDLLQPGCQAEAHAENGQKQTMSEADNEFLTRLTTAITRSMDDGQLTVEHLADVMCLSRSQLNRRVKAITGATTQQFAMRTRLEVGRKLLKEEPQLTVTEVADRCAFDDATSFSRAFRRVFGQSPSEYRNREQ